MNKIPTAEEIANKWTLNNRDLLHNAALIRAMREFAQLHVQAALKAASENVKINTPTNNWQSRWVEKESILFAYPKNLII